MADDSTTSSTSSSTTSSTTNTAASATAPDLDSVFSANGVTAAQAVDRVLLHTPQNARGVGALQNAYFGINHRQTPGAISINKDVYGLTFFTRPNLNLSLGNLRAIRLFNPLTNSNQNSLQRIIRCYLDPRSAANGITSPWVDPQQAFIPILTNTLMSISGWPDITVPYTTSHEGVYKEQFSMVDGVTEIYHAYDIQANFRNMTGDPVTALFFYWAHYMSHVFRGNLVPYPENIVENEIDYQTRIYRLVLDPTKTRVQKIAACGAGFPYADPMGGVSFNYDSERPLNQSNEQISIPFQCQGAIYQDPILLYTFNQTVVAFNDTMADSQRTSLYTKVPMGALGIFNNKGYPRINPDTWELEWWVDNTTYNALLPVYTAVQTSIVTPTLTTGAAPNSSTSTTTTNALYDTYQAPTVSPNTTDGAIASIPNYTSNA
ncbi:hypothetical protein [Paraburkholderia sp. BCC1886]|uniref:hypothetical protein n=1 Tax=Paraburkholderia sp. BCC1886 TaxID=2562670 RepID=UPI001182AC1F|nr:hypothetical protein [Paraburkholderia sp. BCC1886]